MRHCGIVTDKSWIEDTMYTDWDYIGSKARVGNKVAGKDFEIPETINSIKRIYSDEVKLIHRTSVDNSRMYRYGVMAENNKYRLDTWHKKWNDRHTN